MRIGIDIDDTICRTTETVHKKLEEYSDEKHLNPLDIMNDEELKEMFFDKNIEEIYREAEIKRNVREVIKRIRNKGNEIYIITSRKKYNRDDQDVLGITEKWLSDNNIVVDKVITSEDGEEKGKVCKENGIDLMIDNNPLNYKNITSQGVNCLLYDDRGKYEMKKDYATDWKSVEEYVERNR